MKQPAWKQHGRSVIRLLLGLCAHPGSAILFEADDVQIKVSPQAVCLIKNNVACQSVPLRLQRRDANVEREVKRCTCGALLKL